MSFNPFKRIQKHNEYSRAVRELNAMTDRELLDIGITRGSIERAVRNGRAL